MRRSDSTAVRIGSSLSLGLNNFDIGIQDATGAAIHANVLTAGVTSLAR